MRENIIVKIERLGSCWWHWRHVRQLCKMCSLWKRRKLWWHFITQDQQQMPQQSSCFLFWSSWRQKTLKYVTNFVWYRTLPTSSHEPLTYESWNFYQRPEESSCGQREKIDLLVGSTYTFHIEQLMHEARFQVGSFPSWLKVTRPSQIYMFIGHTNKTCATTGKEHRRLNIDGSGMNDLMLWFFLAGYFENKMCFYNTFIFKINAACAKLKLWTLKLL